MASRSTASYPAPGTWNSCSLSGRGVSLGETDTDDRFRLHIRLAIGSAAQIIGNQMDFDRLAQETSKILAERGGIFAMKYDPHV